MSITEERILRLEEGWLLSDFEERVKCLVGRPVEKIISAVAGTESAMAMVVFPDNTSQRFRLVGTDIVDEATIGD